MTTDKRQRVKGAFINTPLQRGGRAPNVETNRFSGLPRPMQTAEAVEIASAHAATPLKRGVNENPVPAAIQMCPCVVSPRKLTD